MIANDTHKLIIFSGLEEMETSKVFFYDIEQQRETIEVANAECLLHMFQGEDIESESLLLLFKYSPEEHAKDDKESAEDNKESAEDEEGEAEAVKE